MTPPRPLHPAVQAVLTRPLACAVVVVVMMMSAAWLPALFHGLPLLGTLAAMLGIGLHVLAPAVVALVSFGGGSLFGLKVAAFSGLGVFLAGGFQWVPAIVAFVLYGLLPVLAADRMARPGGMSRSARLLAAGAGGLILGGLALAGWSAGKGPEALIEQAVGPLFEGIRLPSDAGPEAGQVLERAREMTIWILPGLLAFGIWGAWWGDVALARNIADRHGFYRGAPASALELRFGPGLAALFVAALVAANWAAGDVRYLAVNAALFLAGLLAAQGVAVAHSWLKARGMEMAVVLMYLMLLMWSAMIVPFVIVGLLDIWFDYRRNLPAAGGQ